MSEHQISATDHGGGHGGHGKQSMRAQFVTIFLILTFLTVIEVFIPSVYDAEYDKHLKMILLVLLAVCKAVIVATYFMHLKWESAWVKWIAAIPIYMGFAVIIIMLESIYR